MHACTVPCVRTRLVFDKLIFGMCLRVRELVIQYRGSGSCGHCRTLAASYRHLQSTRVLAVVEGTCTFSVQWYRQMLGKSWKKARLSCQASGPRMQGGVAAARPAGVAQESGRSVSGKSLNRGAR